MNEFLESNRELWDEWTDIHESSDFYRLEEFRADGIRLRDYELEQVGDVHGKSLLHVQCHFGIDTLSWARLGANVTGADFSPKAIALATRLASDLGLDARFVESNVYDLPERLEGTFDVVYTSRGALNWLPDIRGWARVVAHFVAPGGIFFITEAHPIAWTLGEEMPPTFRYDYWERAEPEVFDVEGSYADPTADVKTEREYSWNHGLGEIVTALVDAGLTIELLREYPFSAWDMGFTVEGPDGTWVKPETVEGDLPLFYSLRARKPG
ncbi:MAG: methyltransferase [Actinomycetota bacterium]